MSPGGIRLLLSGDLALGGEFSRLRDEEGLAWQYPFEPLRTVFQEADIRLGNLECCLFRGEGPVEKDWLLYSPADSVAALKYLDYSVMCLGNNHIADCGDVGVAETIRLLDDNKIATVGAGVNAREASRPATIEARGHRVTFLSYTSPEVYSVIATPTRAGCVRYDLDRIRRDVDEAKSRCDTVCVSLHWGREYYRYPGPEQIAFAHAIIDAGAHVIAGHHPHVVQGVERYKHGVIFYSLGNFFMPNFRLQSGLLHTYPRASRNVIVALCEVGDGAVRSVTIVPCLQHGNRRLIVLRGRRKRRARAAVAALSGRLASERYNRFWAVYRRRAAALAARREIRDKIRRLYKWVTEPGVAGCLRRASLDKIKKVGTLLYWYVKLSAASAVWSLRLSLGARRPRQAAPGKPGP